MGLWGLTENDAFDLIPVFGAVNRAVRGEWVDAGIDIATDATMLFTGGGSKAARVAEKLGEKAVPEITEHLLAKGVASTGEHVAIQGTSSVAEVGAKATIVHGFENGAIGAMKAETKTFTKDAALKAKQLTKNINTWRAGFKASGRPVAKKFLKATAANAVIMGGLAGASQLIPDPNEDQGPGDQAFATNNSIGISTEPTQKTETGLIDYLPYVVGGIAMITIDGGIVKRLMVGTGAGAATYFVTHK